MIRAIDFLQGNLSGTVWLGHKIYIYQAAKFVLEDEITRPLLGEASAERVRRQSGVPRHHFSTVRALASSK